MKKQVQNQVSGENEPLSQTEAQEVATEQEKSVLKKIAAFKDYILYAVLIALVVVFSLKYSTLMQDNDNMRRDIANFKAQIGNTDNQHQKWLEESRRVYVFSMEDTVTALGMLDIRREFETKVNKLNDEVRAAERKVKTIKDKAVRSEYSEVYMKSLQIKRDNLIEEYDRQMADLNNRINKALEDIVVSRKLPIVWAARNVAVTTPMVIDITPQVVERLQQMAAAPKEAPQERAPQNNAAPAKPAK